ncbi:MAG: squalene--hopene cyclase [Planctomycetes bacterium]|nr:squalene--hopene cyclase [Planctomycetota bacterium]
MNWDWVASALIWTGLIGTATGAIASTRTQWVRSRPLGNYIAWSVVAHVVLLALAYATKFNYDVAGVGNGYGPLLVRLSSLDELDDAEASEPVDATATVEPDVAMMADRTPETVSPIPDASGPAEMPEGNTNASARENSSPPEGALDLPETPPIPPLIDRSTMARNADEVIPPPLIAPPSRANESAPDKAASERVAVDDSAAGRPGARTSNEDPAIPPDAENDNALRSRTRPEMSANRHEWQPPRREQTPVPRVYQNRSDAQRALMAVRFGGGADTEAAVERALRWLAKHQEQDGRWDADALGAGHEIRLLGQDRRGAGADADTGISALAILSFLGSGKTHEQGEYEEVVKRGLEFLLVTQRSDGSFAGDAKVVEAMYCHGISLLAIAEAYALTKDERLRTALERGVEFTLRRQHPSSGGWRYEPGDLGDTSQFGWQVLALKSAEATGLAIPQTARGGMSRFLNSVSSGRNRGLASYRAGERVTTTMTAEALVCRVFLDECTESQSREAVEFLRSEIPRKGQDNHYYWYYGTLAMFQMQGAEWQQWNSALKEQLLSSQKLQGPAAGSWDPDRQWGQYGGRVFSTALATLCLEVYYRYLPIYQAAEARASRRTLK